jgi:hypothetical protein
VADNVTPIGERVSQSDDLVMTMYADGRIEFPDQAALDGYLAEVWDDGFGAGKDYARGALEEGEDHNPHRNGDGEG